MKLVFIGGGNMAAAMIGGLRRDSGAADEIRVVERDPARCALLTRDIGVPAAPSCDASVTGADIIVLAVKPGDVEAACGELRRLTGAGIAGSLLLSIAAGIPSAAIARWSGTEAVVRAMPNTPALIGQGITGLFARAGVTPAQRAAAERTLQAAGQTLWLADEDLLDAVTAISGSGPAYVFYFIDALCEAACQMGLEPGAARRLAVQTFVGAAQLAAQSTEALQVLRERVTSKGGTTAAALASLAAADVAAAIRTAALAARDRSRELARNFADDGPH